MRCDSIRVMSTFQTIYPKSKTLADFRPFRALRYNTEKVAMDNVIAPPYDVISPEGQDKFYDRDPLNVIRLILNKELPTDHEKDNRYTRAHQFFQTWRKEQVLVQDAKPSFYLYRQTFKDPKDGNTKQRMALLGSLKLEPFDRQVVIPHEKTLSKARADRRKLLETTNTNFSPIFGLYEDPDKDMEYKFKKISMEDPLFEAKDDDGIVHALWSIDDEDEIQSIHSRLRSKKIYIADGHHRYQVALEHGLAMREKSGTPPDKELPSDFVLMALVEFNDPGLVLFPTHRMLLPFEGFEPEKMKQALEPYFEVVPMNSEKDLELPENKDPKKVVFGMFLGGKKWMIRLKSIDMAKKKMIPGKPDVWYSLDVNILAHLIFAALWDLPETKWEATLRFTQESETAWEKISSKEVVAAFILRAPRVEILRDMGEVQELMPQKSTYFYPKLASGLVFYNHS